ncbi:hypothetical protein SUGI_0035800 [Cryptomeria japonica]|nr:uncharacterized protein LOC131075747 isoform X2 [Cryptomeria japonica]XP_057868612.1 uncharacterized protein LOC131075747 isoform X2 [Cryptomeria japonica]GLJ06301.1 hypothetical protein SUGI_0035800 [Cryptomeria japonica]
MECSRCLEGVPFHNMAQCADGHLFCSECLEKHVEEYISGCFETCTSLCCLDTNGCKESFPLSEIQRSLPSDLVERYEQRQAETDIELANLENLVYCPFCNIPYQGNKDALILLCPCSKEPFDDEGRNSEGPIEVEARCSSKEMLSVAEDMECCCCYEYLLFPNVVQCAEGHLFCFQCLRKHVEEYTFGGFQACSSLCCLDTNGCKESFPLSEIRRILPYDVFEKYERRQAQSEIDKAKLEDLVYCPSCNIPYQVDEGILVLQCPNINCSKASCIPCKKPDHRPLRCDEVEKKSETSLRRKIEEAMAKAVIRVCNSCNAELVKVDGCNKVKCKCGTIMCYICRQTIPDEYSHFCQHSRDPANGCQKCKKCGLWATEVEDELARAAKERAMKNLVKEEPTLLNKNIGPKLGNLSLN